MEEFNKGNALTLFCGRPDVGSPPKKSFSPLRTPLSFLPPSLGAGHDSSGASFHDSALWLSTTDLLGVQLYTSLRRWIDRRWTDRHHDYTTS